MSLDAAIQATAAELQTMILNFTATSFVPGTVVRIQQGMRPPGQLHINRATRAQAVEAYYANTVFELPGESNRLLLLQWLWSIPPGHLPHIRTIHITRSPVNSAWFPASGRRHFELSTDYHALVQMNQWPNPVAFPREIFADQSVMKFRETVPSEDGEGEVWKWVGLVELTRMMHAAVNPL